MQKRFALLCERREYITLLNTVPLYLAEKAIAGVDFLTLYFALESAAQCKDILFAYEHNLPPKGERTNGLYFRELQ